MDDGTDCYDHYDPAEAVKWWLKAAEQGNASAQRMIAWCYEMGFGVKTSYKQAYEWYQKAIANGDEDAKAQLELLELQIDLARKIKEG